MSSVAKHCLVEDSVEKNSCGYLILVGMLSEFSVFPPPPRIELCHLGHSPHRDDSHTVGENGEEGVVSV